MIERECVCAHVRVCMCACKLFCLGVFGVLLACRPGELCGDQFLFFFCFVVYSLTNDFLSLVYYVALTTINIHPFHMYHWTMQLRVGNTFNLLITYGAIVDVQLLTVLHACCTAALHCGSTSRGTVWKILKVSLQDR